MKFHDLYRKISYSGLLQDIQALFAHALLIGHHQGLTNEAIVELVGIVLRNNAFSFNHRIYRFIKGCPLNLQLTVLLSNIYLHDWQTPLLRQVCLTNAFYGRFNDTGILTWNGSFEKLCSIFGQVKQSLDFELQATSIIDRQVRFLNAYIENQQGLLYTRVARNRTQQLFVLLYTSNHLYISFIENGIVLH